MTKDDIMMLANQTAGQHWMDEAHIQRFAVALIFTDREDCAKLREARADEEIGMAYDGIASDCASAIRARSKK